MDRRKNLSQKQKDDGYPVIPEKELRCVWMTAGLLSYKLCKYEMHCEACPLDWELRNLSRIPSAEGPSFRELKFTGVGKTIPPSSPEGKPGNEFLKEDPSLFGIHESLFYHRGHTWIKVEKADVVRIGVDRFLGYLLTNVNAVILPLAGRRSTSEKNLCSIIQEEGILQILSPVSGLILSVNQKLKDQPDLIRQDPLGEGFLVTLKPRNFQRDQRYLLPGEEALSWYLKELERFKEAILLEIPSEQERLGVTMQDGGIMLGGAKDLIDPGRYVRLVSAFITKRRRTVKAS